MNISNQNMHPNSSILFQFFKIFSRKYICPIYTKTLQNPSLFHIIFKEHFLQHPQKGVCIEIFTAKEACPYLNFAYCVTGFILRGSDFTCTSVCVLKSCQKS